MPRLKKQVKLPVWPEAPLGYLGMGLRVRMVWVERGVC